MEDCGLHQVPLAKRAWKTCVMVALGVAVMVLAVALAVVLCQPAVGSATAGNSSVALARLEEVLAVTNQSLAETHKQWDNCRRQLGVLEGKVLELEQELAGVTQLQEANRALNATVAEQRKQLGDLQSQRDMLQLQNQRLQEQLQDMRSQHSGGKGLPAAFLSLLALLVPGVLLL